MLDEVKVSCLVKTHILSLKTPPLFARFFKKYALYLLLNAQKGEGAQKKKCVFLQYKKLLFYQAYAKNVSVPSKPPYIKLWKPINPLN